MPKNPLAAPINEGRQITRPIGQPFAPGISWKPAPMPNGKKIKATGQKKGK